MIRQASIPAKELIQKEYYILRSDNDVSHSQIIQYFSDINSMYSKSSVMEDVVLEEYLSLLNTAKTIGSNGLLNKGYIIESYTSQDYIDPEFPVDNQLNLDTQNGDLTLPIRTTKTLAISDVIIEQESNGSFGNVMSGGINADIKAILTTNSGSMFEYELITSSFRSTVLYLAVTLKLKDVDIANGVYIKTHAEEGMRYPLINEVEVSEDGESWEAALSILDINKADHYIRFMPKKIRFIRIKFSQDTFQKIETIFGVKHRYMIGLREISVKQTEYVSKGDYVSKPFSGKGFLNKINFDADEVANNDIRYFISANNGSKWVPIKPKKSLVLENIDLGLRGDTFINSVRVKVNMDRESSPSTLPTTDYIAANPTNKYFLKNTPVEVTGYLGKYISYGDFKQYTARLEDLLELESTGILDAISEDFGCNVNAAKFITILYYIPYYEGIQKDLLVRYNGMRLKNDNTVYVILPHPNSNHSVLVMVTPIKSSGTFSITYNPYVHDHRYNTTADIKLPKPAFLTDAGSFTIEALTFNDYLSVLDPYSNSHVDPHLIPNLFDGDAGTKWLSNTKAAEIDSDGDFWLVQFGTSEFLPLKMYSVSPAAFDWQGNGLDIYKNCPTSWVLEGSTDNGANWSLIDRQELTTNFWNSGESKDFTLESPCKYNLFRFRFFSNAQENPTFVNTCNLSVLKVYTSTNKTLIPQKDFIVLDRNNVRIVKEQYNPRWDYKVSYMPALSITSMLTKVGNANEVHIGGLTDTPVGAELSFDYTYQDPSAKKILRYYTPISREYRIELL